MKNEVQEIRPSNVKDPLETLEKLTVPMDVSYAVNFAEPMSKWPQITVESEHNQVLIVEKRRRKKTAILVEQTNRSRFILLRMSV